MPFIIPLRQRLRRDGCDESYRRMLQSYVDEMVACRDPGEFDPDWSKIRRSWFWGSDEFGRALLDKLEGVRSKTKPDSLGGQASPDLKHNST